MVIGAAPAQAGPAAHPPCDEAAVPARPTAPLLVWAEDTAGAVFETGIQRVVRHLARGLRARDVACIDVGWDPSSRLMRPLTPGPVPGQAATRRPGWLLVPEIPLTLLAAGLDPIQIGRAYGVRTAAIVHDLIPIKRAWDYTTPALTRFARYFRMFAAADLVFATTEVVAADLRAYLAAARLRVPEIVVCPLPAQFAAAPRRRDAPLPDRAAGVGLLCVSTREPRKNLPRLLQALRRCTDRIGPGRLSLTLVGRSGGWADLDATIVDLAAAAGATMLERVDDRALLDLYGAHHASIYPSCAEGFGLPILESLWLGRPCLCHDASSMAEVAPGGGTAMLDMTDEAAIEAALCRLVEEPALLTRLHAEALARPLRDWSDYARDIAAHLGARETDCDGAAVAPAIRP